MYFLEKSLMRNHWPLAAGSTLISNTDFQLYVLRYATIIALFEGMCISFLSACMLPGYLIKMRHYSPQFSLCTSRTVCHSS